MPPESQAPDRPFPGAHSQVPGAHEQGVAVPPPAALKLEARRVSAGPGWAVRLPVRAEQVTVSKAVVVRERVVVRRRRLQGMAQVETEVRRERLRVDAAGQVAVTPAGDDLVVKPTAADDAHASINIARPGAHQGR